MTHSQSYVTAQTVAARFGCKRPSGQKEGRPVFRIPCPAHGGTEPNLSLWDGDGGSIGATCFSQGCSYQSILDALGVEYTYENRKHYRADGSYVSRRRGHGKDFTGNTGSPEGVLVVLLNDADGNAIVLCEGQKAADALAALEIPDITPAYWDGGGGGVDKADYSPLRDRHAILWPDAGPEGRAIMDKAAACLVDEKTRRLLPKSVKMVDVGELAKGQDAADVDHAAAEAILGTAAPYPYESSELSEWINSTQAGDETRTAEALLKRCGDHLMFVDYKLKDKHSIERIEARSYYLRDNGLWEENGPELRARLEAMLSSLRAESWELPPATPLVGGNAVRSQLRRLSDKPDKVLDHLPTIAALWRGEQVDGWEDLTFAQENELDKDGRYLGTPAGVVDLAIGDVLTPVKARAHKVTRSTGVAFKETAQHPDIDKLTEHLPKDLDEYLWAALGRAMWGVPDSVFVLVVGPTDAGKSTLFNAIGAALGPEGGVFSRDLLRSVRKDQGKDGPTPERAPLTEKRIIWALEAEAWVLDGARTKMYAGSEGLISHQPKFRRQGDYPVRATMFVVGNDYPTMPLDDEAIARRLRIVEYQKPTDEDKTLKYRVKAEPQREATLARLVRAAKEHPPSCDPIHIPETIRAKMDKRVADAVGDFGQWAALALVHAPGNRVSTFAVWEAWAAYCGVSPDEPRIGDVARDKDMAARIRRLKAMVSRSLRIDGQVTRGYLDWRLGAVVDCPQCGGMALAADLVTDDERGGTCSECRGDDTPSAPTGEGDGQPQGFEGMGPDPSGYHMQLEEAVEAKRTAVRAALAALPDPFPVVKDEPLRYRSREELEAWPGDFTLTPINLEALTERSILSRQVEGLGKLLAAIRMVPAGSLMTNEEMAVWGGGEKMAEDYAAVFAATPVPLDQFDYARLLLGAKRHAALTLAARPKRSLRATAAVWVQQLSLFKAQGG